MISTQPELVRQWIPALRNMDKIEPIHKGYSADRKYAVSVNSGVPRYLLRTYDISQAEDKALEYGRLLLADARGVACSRPIALGTLPEWGLGYMLVSYIEGEEATEALPLLSGKEQFAIGTQAGAELRKLHEIFCPGPKPSWQESMERKHRRYRSAYAACGVRIREEAKLLSFIDRHLSLMADRPIRLQHDDFHIGNLIVLDGKLSGIIDFNRSDWGDPIHDFLKVGFFSAEISVPFSVGQIRGYHLHQKPDEHFWRLYSLYLAMTLVSSIVWILKTAPAELPGMLMKIDKALDEHDGFDLYIPKWYSAFDVEALT